MPIGSGNFDRAPYYPIDIAVDDQFVYWTDDQALTFTADRPIAAVYKMPLEGGPPTAIATNLESAFAIAVAGGRVYWANPIGGTLMTASTDGRVQKLLARGLDPGRLILDGAYVYWTNAHSIMRAPLDP